MCEYGIWRRLMAFAVIALVSGALCVAGTDVAIGGKLKVRGWEARDAKVYIKYDWSASSGEKVDAKVVLLKEADPEFKVEPERLRGNIGIASGEGREIVWEYLKDQPESFPGEGYYFELDLGGTSAYSPKGTFFPPRLTSRIQILDSSRNGILEVGEGAEIELMVSNDGPGIARRIEAVMGPEQDYPGLMVSGGYFSSAQDLLPGGLQRIALKIGATDSIRTGNVRLRIAVHDVNWYSRYDTVLQIRTQGFVPPGLVLSMKGWFHGANPVPRDSSEPLARGDSLLIVLRVVNQGPGYADQPRLLSFLSDEGQGVEYLSRHRDKLLFSMKPGESDQIKVWLLIDQGYTHDSLSIFYRISDRHPQYLVVDTLRIPIARRVLSFDQQAKELADLRQFDSLASLCSSHIKANLHAVTAYFWIAWVAEQRQGAKSAIELFIAAANHGSREAQAWLERNTDLTESTIVRYENLPSMTFGSGGGLNALAVLRFTRGRASDTEVPRQLVGRLNTRRGVLERFNRVWSYDQLDRYVRKWGLSSANAGDGTVLTTLNRNNIKYLAEGRVVAGASMQFQMRVVRTADGAEVFSGMFKDSDRSTALDDAVMVFEELKRPTYRVTSRLELRREPRAGVSGAPAR